MEPVQKLIEVVGGIIRRGDKFLLGKRPIGKSQGGHWEFIGGKIEPGETPCEALARECREEIALEIVNARVRTAVTHAYPDRTIHLTLIDCEPAPGGTLPSRWPHLISAPPTRSCCRWCFRNRKSVRIADGASSIGYREM